jgi:hypothetical protein
MFVVERHYITETEEIVKLCKTSKELYNRCTFLMRQAWFDGNSLPDINRLVQETQGEKCFKQLHNTKTAKQTIRKVLTDWSNFKKARKAYKKDPSKFVRQPKPPLLQGKTGSGHLLQRDDQEEAAEDRHRDAHQRSVLGQVRQRLQAGGRDAQDIRFRGGNPV